MVTIRKRYMSFVAILLLALPHYSQSYSFRGFAKPNSKIVWQMLKKNISAVSAVAILAVVGLLGGYTFVRAYFKAEPSFVHNPNAMPFNLVGELRDESFGRVSRGNSAEDQKRDNNDSSSDYEGAISSFELSHSKKLEADLDGFIVFDIDPDTGELKITGDLLKQLDPNCLEYIKQTFASKSSDPYALNDAVHALEDAMQGSPLFPPLDDDKDGVEEYDSL